METDDTYLESEETKNQETDNSLDEEETDLNEKETGDEDAEPEEFDPDEQDKYYESKGYIKVAEGDLEELDCWYDTDLEYYYDEIRGMVETIGTYLNDTDLDKLFGIAFNHKKYSYSSNWFALDEIEGVEIITQPVDDDYMINMPCPVCYVEKSKLTKVTEEYAKLARQLQSIMEKQGYIAKIKKKEEQLNKKKEQEANLQKKKQKKILKNRVRELKILAKEREKEAKQTTLKQLTEIADYFLNPVTPFFRMGPALCTSSKKILIITENHMYTNIDHQKHQRLIIGLKKYYDCIEVHEFHKDLRAPIPITFSTQIRLSTTMGWSNSVALLKCVSGHDIDPESVRADYIKWLSQSKSNQ